MPNEKKPNQDHWNELVQSLDLDVDFDEETPAEKEKSEDSGPIQGEKPTSDPVAKKSISSSKVDPLFDLGWNTPEGGKEEPGKKEEKTEAIAAQTPEEPVAKKPKKPRKKKESRGFGFGLLADEPKETPVEPEAAAVEPEPELAFADEGSILPQPIEEKSLSEEPALEMSFNDNTQAEDDSEGASDWMALAAQLGVPIRSTEELKSEENSSEKSVDEDHFVDEETGEEYDPLASWGSPAPTGFRRSKDKKSQNDEPSVDFQETIDADVADQEDGSVIIGKSSEDSEEKPKKERRRGRRRGRRRNKEQEVESVETVEEEETLTSSTRSDAESSEDEESEERSSKGRPRRRSRRSRKPATESKDREPKECEPKECEPSKDEDEDNDVDEELDLDVFGEEEEHDDEKSERQLKSHRGIPSWQDAIGMVIDRNLGTRNERSDEQRSSRPRGGRGRSRRGGGSGGSSSRSKD